MNKILITILAALSMVFIFLMLVIALMPEDFIEGALRSRMEKDTSLSFTSDGFGKKLPFGIEASGVRIISPGAHSELIYFDRLDVSLNPIYLFIGRLRFNVKGVIGGGEVRSAITLRRGAVDVDTNVRNVSVASIPALRAVGLEGSGTISGNSDIIVNGKNGCPDGSLNLEGAGVDLKGVNAAGLNFLLKDKADITLVLYSRGCKATIKNLWVDGKTVKLKAYGDVIPGNILSKSRIDLTLEVLPRDNEGILALFSRYRKTSRFYSMRLRGELASPSVTP